MRTLLNKDIATGSVNLTDDYSTTGPSSTWHILSDVLPPPEPECYIRNQLTCSKEQWEAVRNGTAIVKDWIVVGMEKPKEGNSSSEGEEKAEKAALVGGSQKVLQQDKE